MRERTPATHGRSGACAPEYLIATSIMVDYALSGGRASVLRGFNTTAAFKSRPTYPSRWVRAQGRHRTAPSSRRERRTGARLRTATREHQAPRSGDWSPPGPSTPSGLSRASS